MFAQISNFSNLVKEVVREEQINLILEHMDKMIKMNYILFSLLGFLIIVLAVADSRIHKLVEETKKTNELLEEAIHPTQKKKGD